MSKEIIELEDAIRAVRVRPSMERELSALRDKLFDHIDCDKAFKELMRSNEEMSTENCVLQKRIDEMRSSFFGIRTSLLENIEADPKDLRLRNLLWYINSILEGKNVSFT